MNRLINISAGKLRIPTYFFSLQGAVAFVLFITMVLGKFFTKLYLVPNVFIHDILFLLICLVALVKYKLLLRNPEILFLILLSVGYLLYSIFFLRGRPDFYLKMGLRQYALFLYLAIGYIVFNTIYRNLTDMKRLVRLFIFFGWISYILTWLKLFLIIVILRTDEGFDFKFYSYIAVFGVISYATYFLIFKNSWTKYLFFFTCLVQAVLTSQAAFLLALLLVAATYLFLKIRVFQRLTFLVIGLIALTFLSLSSNFTDINVVWRLLYWKHILHQTLYENYLIKGSGFGVPYMTVDYSYYLNPTIQSPIMTPEFDAMARHLNPPHNSFITFIFHIGLIPSLLLFYPVRKIAGLIILRPYDPEEKIKYFLVISLIGSFVWCCFNVILELPHSAVYFWLMYFTAAYFLKTRKESFEEEI